MSSLNSTLATNTNVVRPPFFFITGFKDIPHVKYYYVFLFFVFVVSVLGNSFVMFIIYIERSFHTPKYMAVFHLVVADLGESTVLFPNLIAMLHSDSQYISFNACLGSMFFVYFFSCLHTLTLVVLAFDRLVAILWPLRYHTIITMPAMAVMLIVVWTYTSVLMISTVSLLIRLSFCKSIVVKSHFCDNGPIYKLACNDNSVNHIMGIVNWVLLHYIPLILILASYVLIAGALLKIASWEGRFKAMKTCSTHLMQVAICYLPINGIYIASFVGILDLHARIINMSLTFTVIPMMNPIIYVLSTEEVKESMKRLFQRKK